MEDKEFRDVAALFAMWRVLWVSEDGYAASAEDCFRVADAMLAARNKPIDGGIAAIRKRRERSK